MFREGNIDSEYFYYLKYFKGYTILIYANSPKITERHSCFHLSCQKGTWQKVVLTHHQCDNTEAKKGSISFSIMLKVILI